MKQVSITKLKDYMTIGSSELDSSGHLNCSGVNIGSQLLTESKVNILNQVNNARELIYQYNSTANREDVDLVFSGDTNYSGQIFANAIDINYSFNVGNNTRFNDSSGSYGDVTIRNNTTNETLSIDASNGDIFTTGNINCSGITNCSGVLIGQEMLTESGLELLNGNANIHNITITDDHAFIINDSQTLKQVNISQISDYISWKGDTSGIIIHNSSDNYNTPITISGNTITKGSLSVSGAVYTHNIDVSGNATINGTLSCQNVFVVSDERLKHNINTIPETIIDKLLQLESKQFSWKQDNTNKIIYGFIAQEVEKIFPEIIHKQSDYLKIDYIQLIPLLLNKIKTTDSEINNLKHTTNEMKHTMDEMKKNMQIMQEQLLKLTK